MSRYASPAAFKSALEQRLRTLSPVGLARRRQLLVFDRFLARITKVFGDAVILKGGLALELRLDRARTTKDIDLRLMSPPIDVLPRLQAAGRLDLDDFLTFEIALHPKHPTIESDGYGGFRYQVDGQLGGKLYGQRFGVDVAFADPIFGEPDVQAGDDVLFFAGIPPPKVRLYPIESHLAASAGQIYPRWPTTNALPRR